MVERKQKRDEENNGSDDDRSLSEGNDSGSLDEDKKMRDMGEDGDSVSDESFYLPSSSESSDFEDSSDNMSDASADHLNNQTFLPDSTFHSKTQAPSLPFPTFQLSRMTRSHHTKHPASFTAPSSTFSSSEALRNISAQRRVADLERELAITKAELAAAKAEKDATNVHAVLSGQEATIWKFKSNKKSEKKAATKRVATDARILTSKDGKKELLEKKAAKVALEKANEAKKRQKKDVERADIVRRGAQEAEDFTFSGSLSSKNKPELVDLAFALKVEFEGASKDVL
ncbi:hypothetical protein DFJ43DRAFT_1042489 [Lentinula guzmanii]|uniref:Uncharacterized protein n=1 Tax=Lentinula guzmanii TaxID=2804957 RepID=A0AA38JCU6_9AGAR|nr:hypothetical protein DFJ43DRAFT_1042489 [Lentinula guzmanii]